MYISRSRFSLPHQHSAYLLLPLDLGGGASTSGGGPLTKLSTGHEIPTSFPPIFFVPAIPLNGSGSGLGGGRGGRLLCSCDRVLMPLEVLGGTKDPTEAFCDTCAWNGCDGGGTGLRRGASSCCTSLPFERYPRISGLSRPLFLSSSSSRTERRPEDFRGEKRLAHGLFALAE